MRKVILHLNMSLDGVVSGIENLGDISDELIADGLERYKNVGTAIFGSNSYPSMTEYWENAEKSSQNDIERVFAKKLNETEKLIISRSELDITWKNTSLLKIKDAKDLADKIKAMKQQEGKQIAVEGGVKIWQLFIEQDIYDELEISVQPVIVGEGRKLFENGPNRTKLELVSTFQMQNGVVNLRYKKI